MVVEAIAIPDACSGCRLHLKYVGYTVTIRD